MEKQLNLAFSSDATCSSVRNVPLAESTQQDISQMNFNQTTDNELLMNNAQAPHQQNYEPILDDVRPCSQKDHMFTTTTSLEQREKELLRRERDVLRYELELTKRELSFSQQRSVPTISANSCYGYAEFNLIIPNFNPEEKTLTCHQWIETVERVKSIYKIADEMVLLIATSKLTGAAKYWLRGRQAMISNWEQFKEDILQAFPSFSDESDIHLKLLSRKKRPNESLEQFYYEMLAIASGVALSDQAKIKYIINGIDNQELRRILSTKLFVRPEELLLHLKWYEDVQQFMSFGNKIVQQQQLSVRNQNRKQSEVESIEQGKQQMSMVNVATDVKCYNCNQKGHISINCLKPQKRPRCEKCSRIGHLSDECNQTIRHVKRISTCSYSKKATINGVYNTTAFIDTGSETSMIKHSLAKSLKLMIELAKVTLVGFGNQLIRSLGRVAVNLKVDDATTLINLWIIDDRFLNEPILIGQDFLLQQHIALEQAAGIVKLFNTNKTDSIIAKEAEGNEIVATATKKKDEEIIEINPTGLREAGNTGSSDITEKKVKLLKCHDKESTKVSYDDINLNEINYGTLSKTQVDKLLELLNTYRSCFAKNTQELGCATSTTFNIAVTNATPIVSRPYKIAHAQKDKLQRIVRELLETHIIRESNSPYSSPALLVQKKDGEERMVIDYRRLNNVIVKDRHPLPLIEDLLLQLKGCKYFIELDLASGYYQIPIAPECQKYTAFVTPDGEYEFQRMPFGLSNGPACFQRMMNKIQRKMKKGHLILFMDDILIPSKSFDEGMEVLEEFLIILKQEGLTLKLKKSHFFLERIDFLGYNVTSDGIRPGERKIEAVKNFPPPQDIHQLRQFIGLTSYFRKFIQHYAHIALPLTSLTRKETEFIWTHKQQDAFKELKRILTSRPLLTLYDPNCEHELHTDASCHGIAGILLQRDHDRLVRPVGYFSRQTTECERNYHSYELEALAVVESVTRFRSYLLGKHFKVITDCEAVRATWSKKNIIPRVARWYLRLMEYDFSIEYRPKMKIRHVDTLSRNPYNEPCEPDIAELKVFAVEIKTDDWLTMIQLKDPELYNITEKLKERVRTPADKEIHKNYKLENGRLFRIVEEQSKWVVPKAAIWRIIKTCHDDIGHYGVEKTLDLLKRDFWFPRMRNKVKNYIASCFECAYNKRSGGKAEGELHNIEKKPIPFHTLHLDHLGPFPRSKSGNTHVLGIVDGFTKYVILKAVKNTSTAPVIKAMEDISSSFGVPTRIITDRGTAFSSRDFRKFCEDNDIKHVMTATRTPRANGQIERYNKTLLQALRTMTKDQTKWDKNLKAIQWGMNSYVNNTTKQSPHELLYGFQPRDPLKNKVLLSLHDDQREQEKLCLEDVRRKALLAIEKSQGQQKIRFDSKRKQPKKYQEGDLVLIERPPIATGESRKLDPTYKGPYIVTKCLGNDRYVLEDVPGAQRTQRKFHSVYASDNMKPWCDDLDISDDSEDEKEECGRKIEDDLNKQIGRPVTRAYAALMGPKHNERTPNKK